MKINTLSKSLITSIVTLIVLIATVCVKADNSYLQSKLKECSPQQLSYFSKNALQYCGKRGLNTEECVRSLTPTQIHRLFIKNTKHTHASCLAVNEYCDPKIIFGPQCCSGLVCTGISPWYNVSKCRP